MTISEVTALVAALGGMLTPIGVIVTAVITLMIFLNQRKDRAQIAANSQTLEVVKKQNDGLITRLGIEADASRQEAKTATAATAVAEAATVSAVAAGIEGVREANRTHEASSAAIEKGAQAAVEPIAEKAVAQGTKEAVAEMKREEK